MKKIAIKKKEVEYLQKAIDLRINAEEVLGVFVPIEERRAGESLLKKLKEVTDESKKIK